MMNRDYYLKLRNKYLSSDLRTIFVFDTGTYYGSYAQGQGKDTPRW